VRHLVSETRRALSSKKKTFFLTDPSRDLALKRYELAPSSWDRFFAKTSGMGLEDVVDTDAPPVFDFEDVVEDRAYAFAAPFAEKKRFRRAFDDAVAKAQLRRSLAEAYEDYYNHELEATICSHQGMQAVAPARLVLKWPDAAGAEKWTGLVKEWIAAKPEDKVAVEERIKWLKNERNVPTNDDWARESKVVLAEFDVVALSPETFVVAEAKFEPTEADAFRKRVADLTVQLARDDDNFMLFRNKRLVPVFYGHRLLGSAEYWSQLRSEMIVLDRSTGRDTDAFSRALASFLAAQPPVVVEKTTSSPQEKSNNAEVVVVAAEEAKKEAASSS